MKSILKKPFYSWIVWSFGALFMFYKYAIEVSPSVMTTHLMSAFHIDGRDLGNLAASYFYAYLIMQIPAGILIDQYGPRKMATLAIVLVAVGSLIFSLSNTLSTACLGRFVSGLGAGFAAVNALKLIANWFSKKRFAFMTGLLMSVAMLGAVIGQAPLSKYIHVLGWRTGLETFSIAGGVLALLFFVFVRDRAPHHIRRRLTPERTNLFKQIGKIFCNKQAWILSLYSGLAFAPITFFGGLWGVPYITLAYDIAPVLAAQAISMIFIGFAIGAPLAGWLSDKIGSRKKVMFFGTALSFFAGLCVLYLQMPLFVLNIALFFFGFFISCFLLCFTMIREVTSVAVAATAIGFMNAFDALLGSISDPLTGWILDLNWDGKILNDAPQFSITAYKYAFILLPAYLIVAFFLIFAMKETYKKEDVFPADLP
jgi:MFS family permease